MYTLEEINILIGSDICEQIFKDVEMSVNADYNRDYGFVEKEVDPSVSMFIPAAGYRDRSDINDVGSSCFLWSSSLFLGLHCLACNLYFDSNDIDLNQDERY